MVKVKNDLPGGGGGDDDDDQWKRPFCAHCPSCFVGGCKLAEIIKTFKVLLVCSPRAESQANLNNAKRIDFLHGRHCQQERKRSHEGRQRGRPFCSPPFAGRFISLSPPPGPPRRPPLGQQWAPEVSQPKHKLLALSSAKVHGHWRRKLVAVDGPLSSSWPSTSGEVVFTFCAPNWRPARGAAHFGANWRPLCGFLVQVGPG